MAGEILLKDTHITFPELTVLTASAGSGKTHALAKRYVQFILSEKIPFNGVHNMLAVTFSNNAAREMKQRILMWLKKVCLGDPETMLELGEVLSLEKEGLKRRAEGIIDEILTYYEDFQIKTIDSFMASLFKASAIDFGYSPDFEILIGNGALMTYAFDVYLRRVREGTDEGRLMENIVDIIEENRKGDDPFLWSPRDNIINEIKHIHQELTTCGKPALLEGTEDMAGLKKELQERILQLDEEIGKSGLVRSRNGSFPSLLRAIRDGRFGEVAGKGCKRLPVNKPKGRSDGGAYDRLALLWAGFARLVSRFTGAYARTYYLPYLTMYSQIQAILDRVKRQEGVIFLEDVSFLLAGYLTANLIPDVYLRLGETISHYLIDEFQDTSPVQWSNLFPLVENALSQGGSLFLVGDTKQAIYGFRNADYTIMKGLERKNPFPSVRLQLRELGVNYRSLEEIVRFTESVFGEGIAGNQTYCEAAAGSGLLGCKQHVRDGGGEKGYVQCRLYEVDEEDMGEQYKIRELVRSLRARGYLYRDITVLAMRNEDVLHVASWLHDEGIPFLSYSSLDVRNRRVTGEIMALLRFLDSPLDDLSLGTFLLGETFRRSLNLHGKGIHLQALHDLCRRGNVLGSRPLYKRLQDEIRPLWDEYFDNLFKLSGYLPLYDLVVAIYETFDTWRLFQEDEEATLARILEVIKDFEGDGRNSLREFLESAESGEEGESNWDLPVPRDLDAVRIMTAHKAKGLGFPVVVLLLYEEVKRGFKYILEEQERGVRIVKLSRETSESDPVLASLYGNRERRFLTDRLNTLYVAFTRAQSELYVVGVHKKRRYPFDLLTPYMDTDRGTIPRVVAQAHSTLLPARTLHRKKSPPPTAGETMGVPGLSKEERERGELIHRVLATIEFEDGATGDRIEAALERWGGASALYLLPVIRSALSLEGLSGYFAKEPGRMVRTEQEYIDNRGNLVRMDRVVIDRERVTVIDFKTGDGEGLEQKNRDQVSHYVRIMADLYPDRHVQGLIAYLDRGKTEEIGLPTGRRS